MGGVAAGAADIFGGAAAVDAGVAAADVAATAAVDAGVATAADVAAGSLSVGDAVAAGATTADLVSAGVPVADLISAGVPVSDLTAAGVTAEQIAAATPALETAAAGAESIPFQLADGTMGSIQGGNILDASGNIVAEGGGGFGLGDLAKGIGYAKTGAQLIGGLGQLVGAQQARAAGKQVSGLQADPYAQYRPQAAAQLQALLANPSTITSTPGYQFNLQQGLQAQQAQQAAQGRLVSGGGLLQANQFGQQYATSNLQQQQNLLATLSGANQSPAGAAQAQQGINFGQVGAGALGLQQLAGGAANVLNPLATLYAQYNNPSPSVS